MSLFDDEPPPAPKPPRRRHPSRRCPACGGRTERRERLAFDGPDTHRTVDRRCAKCAALDYWPEERPE